MPTTSAAPGATQPTEASSPEPIQRAERHAATIAAAMSRVVGSPMHVNDDFFHAGGNSLGALRVVTLLREHDIEVRSLMLTRHRTPRRIAAAIVAQTDAELV
jgi:hypothetical protein